MPNTLTEASLTVNNLDTIIAVVFRAQRRTVVRSAKDLIRAGPDVLSLGRSLRAELFRVETNGFGPCCSKGALNPSARTQNHFGRRYTVAIRQELAPQVGGGRTIEDRKLLCSIPEGRWRLDAQRELEQA
jgi:hypothetical protein